MTELEKLHRRSEIYKLSIARESIVEAAECAKLLVEMGEDLTHRLFRPLHDATVINYGRAFTEMKPFGTISSKWGKFEFPSDQRAHDALIRLRHTMVGHSDHIQERVMVYAAGKYMDNGKIAKTAQTVVLTNYLTPDDFVTILKMLAGLEVRLSIAISENMSKLYGEGGINLKESFELISEDDLRMLSATQN